MKCALPFFCAVTLLAASCTSGNRPADSSRVIVLGIDGGTWTVIEPMMAAGELPNLKKLYDGGLHGILESRPPILSRCLDDHLHGGRLRQARGEGLEDLAVVNRHVGAIWEIVRDAKTRKVDVFNVPATWPPDPVPGVMMSASH